MGEPIQPYTAPDGTSVTNAWASSFHLLLSLRSLYEKSGGGAVSSVGRVKLVRQHSTKLAALQGMMALALASKDMPLVRTIMAQYNKELGA